MDGRRRRGGSPDLSYGDSAGMARNRSVILRTIHGYYKEALDLLPLEDKPELTPRLLAAGVCFGFADPVTNIVANTICFLPDNDGEPEPDGATGNTLCFLPDNNGELEADGAKKRKREMMTKTKKAAVSREEVLSEIVARDVPSRTIAERSLEGLITFLTSYFCHLRAMDALRYLCLAKADLLVAVRLIELDRCYRNKDEFCISSHAAKTALKYAALSARQPNVDGFHTSSLSLAYHLKSITQTVLADRSCQLSIEEIHKLSRALKKPFKHKKGDSPILLAGKRFANCNSDATEEKVPAGLTLSLRAVLIDRIHARYLKAISRLPTQDVRARYHRSLVNAGYCYGPLDPVTNIIINTIWYDTAFPPSENLEVDMICTTTFVRVESRSLSGLIKLLLTCIPDISEHEAMVYLLKNNMKVNKAIQMARSEGCDVHDWDINTYKAAGRESFHPELEAYVDFVMQSLPLVQPAIKSLLKVSDSLSSSEVLQLASLLSPSNCNPAKPLQATLEPSIELSNDALEMFASFKENFVGKQSFFRKKIETALRNEGYLYELHVICGINECVGSQKSFIDFTCPYSHVNFFAKPKTGGGLKLFFAELSNGDDDQSFCRTVSNKSIHARCCYCEYDGIRIVHPDENYCGGDIDFTKMACGEHEITNERIIAGGKLAIGKIGMCCEDYIYLDPTRDTKLIQGMNLTASRANESWSDIMRRAQA
ncbi:hypothetical protein SETIT_1G072900v2 [Setaria italica]|uniref:Uncharacterized protein n=1 Tax=Setaria italica TaxID=4555 RepID=A0A368PHS0_SETIT|nr:hypothetical protein SETIT_1G072900v2 [Setaria italica]